MTPASFERTRAGSPGRTLHQTRVAVWGSIGFAADAYAASEGAAVLTVLTKRDDFRWLDLDKVGQVMTNRAIVDGRTLLDRKRGSAPGSPTPASAADAPAPAS